MGNAFNFPNQRSKEKTEITTVNKNILMKKLISRMLTPDRTMDNVEKDTLELTGFKGGNELKCCR